MKKLNIFKLVFLFAALVLQNFSAATQDLYIIGSAGPNGWNIASPEAMAKDGNTYTYSGSFTEGEFKISTFKGDWCDGRWIMAGSLNQDILNTSYSFFTGCADGSDDKKWLVTESTAGDYTLQIIDNLDDSYTITVNPNIELTVVGGSGSGSYSSGSEVTIVADLPLAGKQFDSWTGDIANVDDILNDTAIVTIPNNEITIIATYKDLPTYVLTVENGTGSGNFYNGQLVNIVANDPSEGEVFKNWVGDVSGISNPLQANTTLVMPNSAITITATYTVSYDLSVINGLGSGKYGNGTKVTILANTPEAGKTFDIWTGDVAVIDNVNSASTFILMPDSQITVTAIYKDLQTYLLTVNNGSGSGAYLAGKEVDIKANNAEAGKEFDAWTGDIDGVLDLNAMDIKILMPSADIQLTATYKNIPIPSVPQAKAATAVLSEGFTANWESAANAKGYKLYVSDDNFSTFIADFNGKVVLTKSEMVNGLTSGTTYKYYVLAYNDGGESAISNAIEVTTTTKVGITNTIDDCAKLYPNPASEVLNIQFKETVFTSASLNIIDASGRILLSKIIQNPQAKEQLNVSKLPVGFYQLSLLFNGKNHFIPVVIK